MMSIPSSSSMPLSSRIFLNSASFNPEQSKTASAKHEGLPVRIRFLEALAPRIRLIASTIRLLPAPVSPLMTLSPFPGSKTTLLITAKSLISSLTSIRSAFFHHVRDSDSKCLCLFDSGACSKDRIIAGDCSRAFFKMH